MSRPKNPDTIRTRLLDVGLAAFAKQGYHGTGIKEIVDAAQVPKGSFYNYFKSKEDFGLAILLRHSGEFWQRWQENFDATHPDPLQSLKGCIKTMLEEHFECAINTCSVVAHLASEMCDTSSVCRITMTAVAKQWADNLAGAIQQAQLTGSVRNDLDATQLAFLFWDAWHGAMLRVKMAGSPEPVKQLVEVMFTMLLPRQ